MGCQDDGMVEWNIGMEYWNGLINAKNSYELGLVMKVISRGTNLQEGAKDVILSLATIGYRRPHFQLTEVNSSLSRVPWYHLMALIISIRMFW